jgi:hypothetical protein
MSMGQMVDDVRLAVNGACPVEFLGRVGGHIPSHEEVLECVQKLALRILQADEEEVAHV